MYGKHFESTYEGSMYGAGVAVFAVWGYVIAYTNKSRVELNPKKLADTLGGTMEEILAAIDFLCRPDPNSRHKDHEGRRLIKEGQFQYFVPSWMYYREIRDADDRREYNRRKQADYRANVRKYGKNYKRRSKPLPGEVAAVRAMEDGDQAKADAITEANLPVPAPSAPEPSPQPEEKAAIDQ